MTKGQPFAKASEILQISRRGGQTKRRLELLLKPKNRLLIAKAGHKSTRRLRRIAHFIYSKASTVRRYIRVVKTLTAAGGIIKKMVTVTEDQGALTSPEHPSTFTVQTPGSFMLEVYNNKNSCDAIVPSFQQNEIDDNSSNAAEEVEPKVVQAHTPGAVIYDMALRLKRILVNRARLLILHMVGRLVRLHREMKGRQLLDVEIGGKLSVFWGFVKVVARIRVLSEWLNINQGFGVTVTIGELDEEKSVVAEDIETSNEVGVDTVVTVTELIGEGAERLPLQIEDGGDEKHLMEKQDDSEGSCNLHRHIGFENSDADSECEDKENGEKINFLAPSAYNFMLRGKSTGSGILQEQHRPHHINTSWHEAKEKLIKTPLTGISTEPLNTDNAPNVD